MNYILVVLFLMNGPDEKGVFVDGWMPMQFDTYAECEERRAFSQFQFETNGGTPPYILACYEKQAPGENL